jgi:hypothetical protein
MNNAVNPLIKKYKAEMQEYKIIKKLEETKDKKKNDFRFGLNILKKVTGIQGNQDKKSAENLMNACSKIYQAATDVTESKLNRLNELIISFEKYRLEVMQRTIGKFLAFLEDLNQKNKKNEYEILDEIGLNIKTIEKMQNIDVFVSKELGITIGESLGNIVGKTLANVMTGKGITTGAVGMTASGITLLAAALSASAHYAEELTKVKEYQKDVEITVAKMEKLWVIMDSIEKRAQELSSVTFELESKTLIQLEYMEPLTIDFDIEDLYYNKVFQKTGLLIKAVSELSKTPLLDSNGNISIESAQIITKTYTILNTELMNHG